jgi:hypothetical protein
MTLPRALTAITALLALTSVAFAGGPAGAGLIVCEVFDPNATADGAVSPTSSTPYVGFNVLNLHGGGQSVFQDMEPGEVQNAFAVYENTDDITRHVVVKASLNGDAGSYIVKITNYETGKDYTDKIVSADGRKFRNRGAGENTPALRVRIKLRNGASTNSELTVRFRGSFDVASRCGDTVKLGDIEL